MTSIPDLQINVMSQDINCRFCQLSQCEVPIVERSIGIAIPSFGALVEGWLLVVPRRHTVSLADLTIQERVEFCRLVEQAEKLVASNYEHCVMFEHGPARQGRKAGCGVDHAHLHIVPINMMLHKAVTTDEDGHDLQWRPAAQPWDAEIDHSVGFDYLFVREADGMGWVAATPAAPSQLFRRAIAKHLGYAVWDWKQDFHYEIVSSTYKRLLNTRASFANAE